MLVGRNTYKEPARDMWGILNQGQKPLLRTFLRNTDVTMARSGFGPYHGLLRNNPPKNCTGVITTSWAMTNALGLVKIGQVHG